MKRWFIVSLLFTLLGGCVVTPVGYRYHDGYRSYDDRGRYGYRDGYRSYDDRGRYDYRDGWGYRNHEQH